MHILYLIHALPWNETTGSTLVLDNYVKQARRLGIDVSVMVPDVALKNMEHRTYDQQVRIYSYKSQDNWGISGFDPDQIHLEFEKPEFEIFPNLVHMINWVNFHPSIFPFLKSLRLPLLRSVCNFEEFCPLTTPVYYHDNSQPCQVPLDVDKCLNCVADNSPLHVPGALYTCKILMRDLEAHRSNYINSIDQLMRQKNQFLKDLYNRYIDYIVFPSNKFGQYIFKQLGEKIDFSVIPHGLDKSYIYRNLGVSHPIKIIYTGGDRTAKGWDIMSSAIEALSRSPNNNFEIYFVGNTNSIPDTYFLNENVKLIRHCQYSREDTFKFLSNFDIAVAPSHFESYGLFVRECVASGVVPIVIPALGVDDFVVNGKNGYLLQEPFAQNLADLIKRLTDEPQALAELKGKISSQHVPTIEEEFAILQELYADLCSNSDASC